MLAITFDTPQFFQSSDGGTRLLGFTVLSDRRYNQRHRTSIGTKKKTFEEEVWKIANYE